MKYDEHDVNSMTHQTFDPVLISIIRRNIPSLIAEDILGVQPMATNPCREVYFGDNGTCILGSVDHFENEKELFEI